MKLILSLSLIWMLSGKAAALQCLTKNLFSNDTVLQPCKSHDDLCATTTIAIHVSTEMQQITKGIKRSCMPSFLCGQTFSQSSALESALASSAHCCNTDGCNNQHVPYPDVHTKNGLQCLSCASPLSSVCNETIECVGVQDRCFSVKEKVASNNLRLLGCMSANMCEVYPQLSDRIVGRIDSSGELKCCGTSFCNSAGAMKLSVVPVMLALIALTVYLDQK